MAELIRHFELPGSEYGNGGIHVDSLNDGTSALINMRGTYWMLSNNGGEMTLGRLNVDHLHHNVPTTFGPYSSDLRYHNASTMAARVAAVMRGESMDYRDDQHRWMSNKDTATMRRG